MAAPEAPALRVRNNSGIVIRLNFALVAGATAYKVYRDVTPGATALIATLNGAPGYDTTVVAGTIYYYRVRASNADGDSAYSNEKSVLAAPMPVPLSPTRALKIIRTF